MVDAHGGVPLPQEGDGLGGVLLGGDVEVNQGGVTLLGQQILVDEVDAGNFTGALLQIAVILDVDAVGHHHVGDGGRLVHVYGRDADTYFGPIHNVNPP